MIRISLICLLSQALGEMHSMEHSVYISRKSRSNALPTHTGHVYNRFSDHPGTFSKFGYNSESSTPSTAKYNIAATEYHFEPPNFEYADPEMSRTTFKRKVEVTEPSLTSYAVDAAIAKAEAKYNSKFLPSKMKTDAMYDRLRSVMYYHPPDNTFEATMGYDMNDYHLDDDDVRTSSRGLYDNWPYFYHSPYEYEHMKIDLEIEKAKDKRYAIDTMSEIPVYDNVNDVPDSYEYSIIQSYPDSTTDNPIHGNAPFFSFILNDYFNKNNDDDPLTFKGIDWGKEFDYQPKISDIDEYKKKKRQDLQTDLNDRTTTLPLPSSQNRRNYLSNNVLDHTVRNYGESSTEKSYNNKNKFDKFHKGNDLAKNHKSAYEHNGKFNKTFKNFVDSFANKFGGEDQKKDSKYVLKMNQDKGEKKKGFRRVYHKDEYQENNEFYDNNNNSAKAEETGSSKAHFGGSEAVLQSHTAASLDDEDSAFNKAGSEDDKLLQNNHIGHEFLRGSDNQFNRYRGVAKQAAQSNSADYTDHYRI
ncbi:hypothetical protein K1T71_012068 [Dendrolimus kikuchii]|uniref:Uncharacterized protein n=1 Tax=Dendrolimus kikuchii TaxID=765133 RepID=A0ACC1CKJ8_9NEOP|nr:hypothetical protein K1T71_012068 [Dendrolimus kikuchii]